MNFILRKQIVFLVLILFLLQLTNLFADTAHTRDIKIILLEIREEQGVSKNSDINPDKVSDELLEELGDAVMSIAHPNEREHELMDNMMGGEGSESLKAMHRAMGYNYLKGNGYGPGYMNNIFKRGYHMMNWNMHGGDYDSPFYMHNRFNKFRIGGIIMWILFLLFLTGIGLLIFFLVKKRGFAGDTALDILKKRYAKGEISKEEYEEKKKYI